MPVSEVTESTGITSSQRATYRVLGYLAILHSVLLLLGLRFVLFGDNLQRYWWFWHAEVLWAGLATLWFLWPIILALHAGRSSKRAYFSLGVAAVIFIRPACWYFRFEGARVLMSDEMIGLSPYELIPYAAAYVCGLSDGYRDARNGRLILEAYGFGTFAPNAPSSLCQFPPKDLRQCGIQFNHVTGCNVNSWILGHARSYNRVMTESIRRHCPVLFKAAEEEDARSKQSWKDGDRDGHDEAIRDIANGQLFLELSDVRKEDPEFEKLMRERYRIGIKHVDPAADIKLENKVFAHQDGYNRVAEEEIRRRFGKNAVKSIWDLRYQVTN